MQAPSLSTDVQYLKGVGPRLAVGLNKAGIKEVGELFYRLPRRYEDRSSIPPISSVRPGQYVTIHGRVMRIDGRPTRGGRVLMKATVSDGTGSLTLSWFNQPWVKKQLESGTGEIYAYGLVKPGANHYEIASPEWENVGEEDDPDEFGRIVPVYPLTEGLSQRTMRRAVRSALAGYLEQVRDPLPAHFKKQHGLPDLIWSLRQIHLPASEADRLEARRRLVFEEFFYLQLALCMRRAQTHLELGISFPVDLLLKGADHTAEVNLVKESVTLFDAESIAKRSGVPLRDQIAAMLPFQLTRAQQRVIEEIWADMKSPHPMNRLVQGDVGSGKTAVAEVAMLTAVRGGFQAALMAPTEILAEQHYFNLRMVLEPLGIRVGLFLGKQNASDRKRALDSARTGESNVIVGTHALIQEGVEFNRLGLVIVDEQHRFGVLQRLALREKSAENPDVLVMTATPIPRTLTMAVYGDLDLSVIDELPPGRHAIKTHWKRTGERAAVYQAVKKVLGEGRQAYVVCPMVSDSEKMMAQAAEDLYYRLANQVFPDLRVDLLHGQMKAKDKEAAVERFRDHETDVLVSTTVIEVGVDVPNASVMIVEDANRFGLSQLHQLRGRVGRGPHQSYCVLIADAGEDARSRMEILVGTNDGFEVAEADLRLRGPGMIAGTQQSGNADFKIADLVHDGYLLEKARQAAMQVIEKDPKLEAPEWSLALQQVHTRRSDLAVITVS